MRSTFPLGDLFNNHRFDTIQQIQSTCNLFINNLIQYNTTGVEYLLPESKQPDTVQHNGDRVPTS